MARHRLLGLSVASWAVGLVLAGAICLLAGCGASGDQVTGAEVPVASWRGAAVSGERAAELPRLLERAWPRVTARYPGWSPTGWRIVGWAGRIPCAGFVNGSAAGCRGTTTPGTQTINVSWINGAGDVVAIAEWELCNAAQQAATGLLRDVGCL